MTSATFGNRLDDLLSRIVDETLSRMPKAQASMLDEVLALISSLDVDKAGNIRPNTKNLRIIRDLERKLPAAMITPEYDRTVKYLTAELEAIAGEIDGYLTGKFPTFDPNTATLEQTMIQAIQATEGILKAEGFKLEIVNKVRNVIQQNVTSGLKYRDLIKQVREFLTENDGRLVRWTKTIVTDAAYQTARNYIQTAAQDIEAKHWRYFGGIIKDSRPFCKARDGKIYTDAEVRSWAKLDWEGKNPLTTAETIYTYCGGYNCRHNLIPALAEEAE